MPRQFLLWPKQDPATTAPPLWEDLDEPERTKLILAWARLISKAVEPPTADLHTEEDDHER